MTVKLKDIHFAIKLDKCKFPGGLTKFLVRIIKVSTHAPDDEKIEGPEENKIYKRGQIWFGTNGILSLLPFKLR